MDFKERIYSVLIVSAAPKFNTSLMELFSNCNYYPTSQVQSISAARRALIEREYDFVVINSPLPDDDGIRFSIDISSCKNSVVMMLIRSEIYDSVLKKFPCTVFIPYPNPHQSKSLFRPLTGWHQQEKDLEDLKRKLFRLKIKCKKSA